MERAHARCYGKEQAGLETGAPNRLVLHPGKLRRGVVENYLEFGF
jgi:hypothetical protein